jgi:hypothetical protein
MTGGNPDSWLAARLAAGMPAETWKPVPGWYYEQNGLSVPAVPHQGSDQGRVRNAKGAVLADRPNGRPRELPAGEQYRLINLCTGGVKKTVPVHHVILAAHCPEDRDGRDTRHLGRGRACRAWNWYPEGVCYGTQSENEMDKPAAVRIAASRAANAARAVHPAPPAKRSLLRRVLAIGRFFRRGVR